MKMLVAVIRCMKVPVGEFKVAVNPGLETLIDQLDFKKLTPINPFTREPLTENEIQQLGGHPFQAEVTVDEMLSLLQFFRPLPEAECGSDGFPRIIEVLVATMRACLEAVRDREDIVVDLRLFPCFSALQSS